MKIWHGYGSEHSANLVMIGRFATPEDAELAEMEFKKLREVVYAEFDYEKFKESDMSVYANDTLREALTELRLYDFSPQDVEHFSRDHSVQRRGNELRITTDESDVNGFLKVMLGKSARIEIYSAHDFPENR